MQEINCFYTFLQVLFPANLSTDLGHTHSYTCLTGPGATAVHWFVTESQEHTSSKRSEFRSKNVTIPNPYSIKRELIAIPSMVRCKAKANPNSEFEGELQNQMFPKELSSNKPSTSQYEQRNKDPNRMASLKDDSKTYANPDV